MKKIIPIGYAIALMLLSGACEQEIIDLEPAPIVADTSCQDAQAGTADFTKFVAIGNSFVAGFQAGALFNEGQANSLAAIMNKQFECVGAPADFKQPAINAELGWNLFVTQPFLTDQTQPILGRMLLQYGDNTDCLTGDPAPLPTMQAYVAGE